MGYLNKKNLLNELQVTTQFILANLTRLFKSLLL